MDNMCLVVRMSRVGMAEEEIAFVLGISVATLTALYGNEIKAAAITAKLEGLEALWAVAQSGRAPVATIYWAKTRCGLRATTATGAPRASSNERPKKGFVNRHYPPGAALPVLQALDHNGEVIVR
jgi:hypothetical protein